MERELTIHHGRQAIPRGRTNSAFLDHEVDLQYILVGNASIDKGMG